MTGPSSRYYAEGWADRVSDRSSSSRSSASTAPTSIHSCQKSAHMPRSEPHPHENDFDAAAVHTTAHYESSSAVTFDSSLESDDESSDDDHRGSSQIPPLPVYRKAILSPMAQPSNYRIFPELFPSMDRMLVRHDEYTSDGNMNLRVDTQLPHRPQRMVQLFHLRMYDLDARIFSLRRYCRESGREVCRTKREYSTTSSRGPQKTLQRSVSSVFRSLGARPQFRRQNSTSTLFSFKSSHSDKRPDSSLSMRSGKHDSYFPVPPNTGHGPNGRATATNTIKLMFTNYASVEVLRRGGSQAPKRYDFEWWGRRYSWKRVYNANLNMASFHLVSDDRHDFFLANIVPEARSPNELTCDELDGGWMPPCTMWFSLELEATLAEVYVATGLVALVDDCIRERWEHKKESRLSGLCV